MAMYGCVGRCMAMYGCVWLCRAVYGCVCLCSCMYARIDLFVQITGDVSWGIHGLLTRWRDPQRLSAILFI